MKIFFAFFKMAYLKQIKVQTIIQTSMADRKYPIISNEA